MHQESTIAFGPGQRLVGTLSTAPGGPLFGSGVVVLLTNAGVIGRSGPHRLNVKLARRLAEIGVDAFRFDLGGLGDSRRSDASGPPAKQAVSDVRKAIEHAGGITGASRFVMFAICSGGPVAMDSALEDDRLCGLFIVDDVAYPTWKTHWNRIRMRIRAVGPTESVRMVGRAIGRGFRSVRRGMDSATSVYAEEVNSVGARGASLREYAGRMMRLATRGCAIRLFYSGAVADRYNYPEQFSEVFSRFGFPLQVSSRYAPECDHTFTTERSQRLVIEDFLDWVTPIVSRERQQADGEAQRQTAVG